jgi:hypothetical protein
MMTYRLPDATTPILRRRCCYCDPRHPLDGFGPILAGDLVSDGICDIALARINAELDAMERDEAGRDVAPRQTSDTVRPMGPFQSQIR